MAREPEKMLLHRQRERVLALGRLFEPDPERPGEISSADLGLPLPEGLSCRARAADELLKLLGSPFADVRRLAASALGKMAAKAVGRYPKEALGVVDVMKDVARDETAPGYVRTAAAETVAAIQKAARKQVLYQRAAKKLISVSFRDDANLVDVLKEKLSRYIRFSGKEDEK